MIAIHIENLHKTYSNGTQALKGVDLDVAEGDFFALLGANGAGKTTIIGILTGLVNKTSGKVKVFDHDLDHQHPQAKKLMGVVPQEINFNQFERVEDIVLTTAGYFGVERPEAKAECQHLLKKLKLWDKRDVTSRSLSGGMKRRLMIARALVTKPKLLILDEPTAGVDVELRFTMWEFIRELNRQGTTVLLTTHYLEEVEQLCRHAAMIKDGQIIAHDSVRNLVKQIDLETYVVTVDKIKSEESLKKFNFNKRDDHSFEIDISKDEKMTEVLSYICQLGMNVIDFRPLGNRIEKLFLKLLKH